MAHTFKIRLGSSADAVLADANLRFRPRRGYELAVRAEAFPICNKDFAVPIAGNSSKEASYLKGFAQGEGVSPQNSLYFPTDQGILTTETRSP